RCLVRLGQAQGLVGDVVENHLPAHRSDTRHARGGYQRAEPVLAGEAVSAEGVHGLVDGLHTGFGGRVLGHVGGLARAGVVTGVVEVGGLLHHQAGEFEFNVRLGEGVGDGLVGADGGVPDGAFARV